MAAVAALVVEDRVILSEFGIASLADGGDGASPHAQLCLAPAGANQLGVVMEAKPPRTITCKDKDGNALTYEHKDGCPYRVQARPSPPLHFSSHASRSPRGQLYAGPFA